MDIGGHEKPGEGNTHVTKHTMELRGSISRVHYRVFARMCLHLLLSVCAHLSYLFIATVHGLAVVRGTLLVRSVTPCFF